MVAQERIHQGNLSRCTSTSPSPAPSLETSTQWSHPILLLKSQPAPLKAWNMMQMVQGTDL
jgi:hypothetical protein